MQIPDYSSQIKAVFFDIDETLYMKDTDTLPESVFPALKKLQENNILIGIATGRVVASFPPKIQALIHALNINTFVTSNGQFVQCQGEVLRNAAIPLHIVRPLLNFFQQEQIAYAVINNHKLCVSEITPRLEEALNPITHNYSVDPNYCDHHPILQILSFSDESQDELIENSGFLAGLKTIRWHKNSLDILESEGSKARGIAEVAKHLGFSMENIMAFGDGLNDLEMLSQVGVGVAMGNGHPKLKAQAKHVGKEVDKDGIADFLARANLI